MDLRNGITQRWSAIWFSYVDAFWGTWFVLCILKTETCKIICEKDKYFLYWFKCAQTYLTKSLSFLNVWF